MSENLPYIKVVLRVIGQAACVDSIEISHGPNTNGKETEAWRLTSIFLLQAAQIAMETYESCKEKEAV